MTPIVVIASLIIVWADNVDLSHLLLRHWNESAMGEE